MTTRGSTRVVKMKRWILGLVALGLTVLTIGALLVQWQGGSVFPPGFGLLNQPWVELLQENVTLEPGETKEIYCILHTKYFPARENWIEIYTGLNEQPPLPEGIRIYAPHPEVEPYENVLIRITIETYPELEPGAYVFYIGNNGSSRWPTKLTLNIV